MLGVLQCPGTQEMPPSNQPMRSAGWSSRIPPKMYLENVSRKPSTLIIMPTTTWLNSHGSSAGSHRCGA